MKATPRPWYYKDCMIASESDPSGKTIALICSNEADARLIAAAPDLLDTVEQVLIASEEDGDMEDIDWDGLRAAIAKTEAK